MVLLVVSRLNVEEPIADFSERMVCMKFILVGSTVLGGGDMCE